MTTPASIAVSVDSAAAQQPAKTQNSQTSHQGEPRPMLGHVGFRMSSLVQSKIRNMEKSQKKFYRVMLLTVCVSLLLLVAMIPIVILGNEITKDAKVQEHAVMTNRDGEVVKVDNIASYASLWDLPSFDSQTLSKLHSITLLLSMAEGGAFEGTFHVAGALRRLEPHAAHARAVSILTTDGGEIVVDAKTYVAVATISGKTYAVTGVNPTSESAAQAFDAEDFFIPEHGFTSIQAGGKNDRRRMSRRLQAASGMVGYAAFTIKAAEVVLDEANADAGAMVYSSIYLHGTLTDLESQRRFDVRLLHNASEHSAVASAQGSLVLVREERRGSVLTELNRGIDFVYDSDLKLIECRVATHGPLSDSLILADFVTNGAAANVASVGSLTAALVIHAVEFDPPQIKLVPEPPSDIPAQFDIGENGRRALKDGKENGGHPARGLAPAIHEPIEYLFLWHAARGAYKGNAPLGWTTWHVCEQFNSYARFMYRGRTWVLAFSGTDDVWDWIFNNFNTGEREVSLFVDGETATYHAGFVDYVESVAGCVNSAREYLRDYGIELSYVVGHSLGGTAATIYSQMYGDAIYGVATYGAMETRFDMQDCAQKGAKGIRFFHEDDIAATDNELVHHDVKTAVKLVDEMYCGLPLFFGLCLDPRTRKVGYTVDCAATATDSSLFGIPHGIASHNVYPDYPLDCCTPPF